VSESGAVVLLSTAGTRDEAERLGEALVESGLAASCAVIPMIHTIYKSQGRLVREHEAMLLVKTSAENAESAQAHLLEHHSSEIPEVLRLDVDGGSPAYLKWLVERASANSALKARTDVRRPID
jgi:periplasmic divalent cation tolerance protein